MSTNCGSAAFKSRLKKITWKQRELCVEAPWFESTHLKTVQNPQIEMCMKVEFSSLSLLCLYMAQRYNFSYKPNDELQSGISIFEMQTGIIHMNAKNVKLYISIVVKVMLKAI